jgi:hypothetical protein
MERQMAKATKVRSRRTKASTNGATKSKSKDKQLEELVGYCEEGEPIEISDQFLDYVFLLYGESGSGKTSTLSKCPGSYIVQCDPKRKGLKVRQTNVPDLTLKETKQARGSKQPTPWDVIEATFARILEDDSVNTVIIDNIRAFYQHALNHYCAVNMVDTVQQMDDYGVSWDAIDEMYLNWWSKIVNSGRGLGLIAHQREREIKLPDDTVVLQIQPDVSGRAFQAIRSITDFAFYLGKTDHGRVLTIRHESNDIWYKCCTDEDEPRFYDPQGKPVHRISAGDSPSECWGGILLSWDNKLQDVDYQPPKPRREGKKRRSRSDK